MSASGLYQKMIWNGLSRLSHQPPGASKLPVPLPGDASTSNVVAVQTTSSCLAGCTSAFLTAPLDLIKTRIQVRPAAGGGLRWVDGPLSGFFACPS